MHTKIGNGVRQLKLVVVDDGHGGVDAKEANEEDE
jgi:hypothetical protein